MNIIKFISLILRRYTFHLILYTVLILAMVLLDMASIVAIAPFLDSIIGVELKDVSTITRKIMAVLSPIGITFGILNMSIMLVTLFFLKSCLSIWVKKTLLKIRYNIAEDMISDSFESYFQSQWIFFSGTKQGNLINTFTREILMVVTAFGAMGTFFSDLIQVCFYFAIPFYISWQVTSICLFSSALIALPFFLLGKISYRLGKESTATSNVFTSVVNEHLGLAKIIMGFSNQHTSIRKVVSSFNCHKKVAIKSMIFGITLSQIYTSIGTLILVIAMFIGRKSGLPLSELTVLVYSLYRTVPKIGQIVQVKHSIDNFFPSYEQVISYKNQAEELKQFSGDKILEGIRKGICIKDLSFTYPGHKPVLNGINMNIPKGKMIAIVGKSGSGKSTLIDLIMGLNHPASGKIEIDGISLKDFDINSYRKRIGYVPQESTLFNMTIAENLRWADGCCTDEEIRKAAYMANADKFIDKFPDRYDTVVGDRGVRLSGGQSQRIALARAIIRKPELLILDEATSALDTQSERLIQQAIEKIAGNTTVIVIAHRLSTITNSDYIYVLEQGRIVEDGTYSELVMANGYFKKMVAVQELEEEKIKV